MALMLLAGQRYLPGRRRRAVLARSRSRCVFSTLSILSLGFVIASLVPTARFAQPIGALILYPMLGLSGLFVPVDSLPAGLQAVARVLPLTYAVSLLRGIWRGDAGSRTPATSRRCASSFVVCTALSVAGVPLGVAVQGESPRPI